MAGVQSPDSGNPKLAHVSDMAFELYAPSYQFEVNAYDFVWYFSNGYSFPNNVPAFLDPNDLQAEILFNGSSFTPRVYTPYVFGATGNEPFETGTYSVFKGGYTGWLPQDITFASISTDYATDFLGISGVILIDGTTPPPAGVTILPGGDNGMPGTDGGIPAVVYTVTTTGVWDVVVNRPAGYPYPWYAYLNTVPMLASGPINLDTYTFENVDFGLVKGPLVVTLDDAEDLTLPVELSSFTALVNSENLVSLQWTTQSETNLSGYGILRNVTENLDTATDLNQFIEALNSSTSHTYSFVEETELEPGTYYYWLQAMELSGESTFHGPTSVTVTPEGGTNPPPVPTPNAKLSVYPNPFNPVTQIAVFVPSQNNGQCTIYNQRGEVVYQYAPQSFSEGWNRLSWNGMDKNGNSCGSGVYLLKVAGRDLQLQSKLVLMK